MNILLHVGFGNMVNADKIVAILQPDSAPVKRMVQHGKEAGTVVDATQGRKTKAVLLMDQGSIVLSALTSDTISMRAQKAAHTDGQQDRMEGAGDGQ